MLARLSAVFLVAAAASGALAERSDAAPRCPVTHPNVGGPSGQHGRGSLSVYLGPKATFVASRDPQKRPKGTMVAQARADGSIYAKFLWLRAPAAYGRMRITAIELHDPGARMRAAVDPELLESPYVPSALTFSKPGCWRVTARAGKGRLRVVVKVVNASV